MAGAAILGRCSDSISVTRTNRRYLPQGAHEPRPDSNSSINDLEGPIMAISAIGSTAAQAAATGQQAAIQALHTAQENAKTQANALLELLQAAVEATEVQAQSASSGGRGLDLQA